MTGLRLTLVVLTSAAGFLALSALPAFGADSGTVAATVTAESTCIVVAPTAAALGTLPFSTTSAGAVGTISPTVTSCTSAGLKLFARGTDATGTGATWLLSGVAPCVDALDHYVITARSFSGSTFEGALTHIDQQVSTLGPNQATAGSLDVVMPCTGSTGAGVEMSFSVVFTATL